MIRMLIAALFAAVMFVAGPATANGRAGPPVPVLIGSTYLPDVGRHAVRAAYREVAHDVSSMADAAYRFIGSGNITGHSGPWCVYYVNYIAQLTGHQPAPGGMTYAVARMGPPTYPHKGAIAYNGQHAGIVLDVQGGEVIMVSGNNHEHRVGVSRFRVGQFAYVEPTFVGDYPAINAHNAMGIMHRHHHLMRV